jgi:ferredoxin
MRVKFIPQNIELEVTPDKSLLQIATENNIEIKSICKGVPSCAECRVRVVEGENNVLPPSKPEINLIGTSWRIDSRRLSCQLRCFGDVTVDLTEQVEKAESQTKKVRGYRSQKQVESHAVQDTMLLTEKPEDKPQQQEAREPREPREPREQKPQQQRNQQQQNKQQGKGQQRPQQQKPQQQKNQNQQQGKPQGQQQGPKPQNSQQQQQKQNQNQNQNKNPQKPPNPK